MRHAPEMTFARGDPHTVDLLADRGWRLSCRAHQANLRARHRRAAVLEQLAFAYWYREQALRDRSAGRTHLALFADRKSVRALRIARRLARTNERPLAFEELVDLP
jgi:hypothetical protein